MVSLQRVEIPGYREAIRREREIRDGAWLDGTEAVAGVEVKPLDLRTVILLERAKNGHFVPCSWDNRAEAIAHAIMVLYFCSPKFAAQTSLGGSFVDRWRESRKRQKFINRVMRFTPPETILRSVRTFLDEAFMDAPSGSSESSGVSHAATAAYIIDLFAEAGYAHTEEQIMTMPLKRLWQLWRLAAHRTSGLPLTNPSDDIACAALANMGGRN